MFEGSSGAFIHGNANFTVNPEAETFIPGGQFTEEGIDVIRQHIRELSELRHKESVIIANIIQLHDPR